MFVSHFRKFIEMGFIDQDKIGIWGWVSGTFSPYKVLSDLQILTIGFIVLAWWNINIFLLWNLFPKSLDNFFYLATIQNAQENWNEIKRWDEVKGQKSVVERCWHAFVWVVDSHMVDMWRLWFWVQGAACSNVELLWLLLLSGSIMVCDVTNFWCLNKRILCISEFIT